MTDPLTEAVRRLKELQEDVERLKAARDEAGETRLLRRIVDQTDTSDSVSARENDRAVTDQTDSSDTVSTTTGSGSSFTWADHSGSGGDQWDLTEWQDH